MPDFGTEELARDDNALISGGPKTATWDEADYVGMIGPLVTTKPNQSGGFLPEYDLSWTTSLYKLNESSEVVSRFADDTLPEEGDVLTIDEVDYKIDRITKDPFSSMIQFDLVNENKH